jgi:hypothetical protein
VIYGAFCEALNFEMGLETRRADQQLGGAPKFSESLNYSHHVLNAPEFRESPQTTRGPIGDLGRTIDHPSPSISQGASRTCRTLIERQRATRGRPNPPSRSCSPIGHLPPPDRMHPPKPPPIAPAGPPRSRSLVALPLPPPYLPGLASSAVRHAGAAPGPDLPQPEITGKGTLKMHPISR